jgi:predicted glycosyltransferase
MLWVQHLMGIGHQRRAASIARLLCQRGAKVCYVSGGYPLTGLDIGKARLIQLPSARAADVSYETLLDAHGEPVSPAWQRARRDMLLTAFDDFRPDVLVTESYPFGRSLLRFELEPLIERAHRQKPRPRLLCSVRDIIQPRSDKRNQSIAELVRSRFDRVLVHSDPKVVEFSASFPAANAIREQIRYTGYVTRNGVAAATAGEGAGNGTLVSGGGGVVAKRLLEAAIRARPLSRLRHEPWRVLAGPAISEAAFQRLQMLAEGSVRVERNRADFPRLLANCRVSVSQGGYNTLLDIVQARARAVIVPFSDGDQAEQSARALLFQQKGLVHVLAPETLAADTLAAAIDRAASLPRPPSGVLDLGGAQRSAELVLGNHEERR